MSKGSDFTGKKILIRADAAPQIGSGHIMRSSVLAKLLQQHGAQITYVCRSFTGHMQDFLRRQGFTVCALPVAPDWVIQRERTETWLGGQSAEDAQACFRLTGPQDIVIADHYGIDETWCKLARNHCRVLVCLDDEAQKPLDCDIVLNQNYYPSPDALYAGLIPDVCQKLIGPRYALLRPEFADARKNAHTRHHIKNVLVLPGGNDHFGIARQILEHWSLDARLTLVVGNQCDDPSLEERAREQGHTLIGSTNTVETLMLESDFCIGAGGSTSWERCCLKLPSALFVLADNQAAIAANLELAGACINLGRINSFDFTTINQKIGSLTGEPSALATMSEAAGKLTDGLGAIRVLEALQSILQERS
ncbi:MAG: UDP-2,4-diacetamido-2,4,6-trideoxy-beta-L-altropyranose hydrolase [Alphaproteobacteria bacterium]|nr:UDP-2,4-diacetamido-2,4,6-trideoxy-beta-L-altropyranose hydrolase [Alphaproteobacteria bacterium]